ncbi:2-methoxy-6-polyprenyl-1,4-benzoquinol methylase [subsurface metagenome]
MEAILENNREVWNNLHKKGYRGYRKTEHADQKLNALTRNLPKGWLDEDKALLEIGCGVGHWMEELSSMVLSVHGVDISKVAVEFGRIRLYNLNNVFFHVTKGNELSMFDNDFFHLVYSFGLFQHIPRQATADYLKEAYRVLKVNGLLVFQVTTYFDSKLNQKDIGLIQRYETIGHTEKQLKQMVSASNLTLEAINRQRLTSKHKNWSAWLWAVCRKKV